MPLVLIGGIFLIVLFARHMWFIVSWQHYQGLALTWMMYFVLTAAQWSIAWRERPFVVTPRQQDRLDRMRVTVNVPLYNEDPVVVDRVLYALFRQTRLPDRVEVVDDGSNVDYIEVRDWWRAHHPAAVEFSWIRQENLGKKRAQARTFRGDPADVFVTLDSDTALAARALEEGLKPFADRRVQSVAGLELAWNHDRNLLTRLNSIRQLSWQLITCSAQNVLGGSVLINRGTYALYRGALVRDVLPAYVNETFFGHTVMLADDTFLTTMALCRGRAVQQPSAVCLAMYPETSSHQMRQWIRWMRGTTIRNFWRLRYLPMRSWGWLYTVISLWWFLTSLAITVISFLDWPASAGYTDAMIAASAMWSWGMATRIFVIKRSDQDWLGSIGSLALAAGAAAWVYVLLRPLRIYGTVTCLRQEWTTRTGKVEVRADELVMEAEHEAVPA